VKSDVKDLSLANDGRRRIEWADHDMPVLQLIRQRFGKEKPLKGMRMAACLHVTAETANLCRTLKAGGADLVLCASNPLSTQDDVAAALVKHYGVPVGAIRGENRDTYYRHIVDALKHRPEVTMDDGADLVSMLHTRFKAQCDHVLASMEETTTGVIRLRAMAQDGSLRIPVVAVNDAETKYLFDNRYGTGQSTLDGIIRATDLLLAGKHVVVAGYGWCGRGVADRARGLGAHVIVTEVEPVKALQASMDGFEVMPMKDAARIGELFITLTGDINVIDVRHMRLMKDGAVVCNSGHFNVEINIPGLKKIAKSVRTNVRPNVDEYTIAGGRRIYLLAEGRLVNLSCAEGHPASVMDMSFATQALTSEYFTRGSKRVEVKVHDVPDEIEDWVAKLKLRSMGVKIDTLTPQQKKYLSSWDMGT